LTSPPSWITSTSTATSCSRRIRGAASSSPAACNCPPSRRDSVSRPRRLLILAEARSGDPHFGKTARGVMRYAPEDVVALLDSQSAAESVEGFPLVLEGVERGGKLLLVEGQGSLLHPAYSGVT